MNNSILLDRDAAAARKRAAISALAMLGFGAIAVPAQAAISPATQNGPNATAPVNNGTVGHYVSDAQKALKEGNVRLAIILLKNAVSVAPKNGVLRGQLGFVLMQAGQPVEAEQELRHARADGAPDQVILPALLQAMLLNHNQKKLLEEFPDPGPTAQGNIAANILKGRAMALQATGQTADAVTAMDRSLAMRRDVSGLLSRAQLAEAQKDLNMAKALTEEALKSDPKNTAVLMFKLGVLMLANDSESALALSNQLIQANPNNWPARFARIETYLKLKQDGQAKADVDSILAKAPNNPMGLYYRALLLARANKFKEAWQIAQSLPPEFTQSQSSTAIMVAQMAISSGNVETGGAILAAASAKSPNNAELRLRLAAVRLRQNSAESALNVLQPVKDSSDPRILAMLSQIYLKLNRYSDAIDTLNKLNANVPGNVGLKRELALIEMQAGQSDQALKDLLDLGAKQPTDPTVVAPLIAALVQAKRFPEALAAADRLGADPKQRVQSSFYRGQVLILQGDQNGALAAFQKALQMDPKNVASLYFRAQVLMSQHKLAEATRDLQTVLTIDPKNIATYVKLAEVYAQLDRDTDVRASLAKATSLAPSDPSPRLALTRYLVARRDLKGALAVSADVVRTSPKNSDALSMYGQLQLALGQKKEAADTFRRLTDLQSKSAKPRLLLANALFASGDQSGAASALAAAATLEPNSGDVYAAQINLLLARGDIAGAVAKAKAYRSANPGSAADVLVSDTLVKAKQNDQALAILTQSFAARPNATVLVRLVQLKVAAGDTKQSATLLSNWLASNPNDVVVRNQYASLLMTTGDTTRAAVQFALVLKQDPKNLVALNNLGWILQRSDPKRALSLVMLADKLSPNTPEILDTMGMIKLGQKDTKGALDLINRAHALSPNDAEITYHVALTLDANGRRDDAKRTLKALLDSGAKFAELPNAMQLLATWR